MFYPAVVVDEVRWVSPRHVWVNTSLWGSTGTEPGILLAWRQVPGSDTRAGLVWEALVVRASSHQGLHQRLEVSVQQQWIEGSCVRPVGELP